MPAVAPVTLALLGTFDVRVAVADAPALERKTRAILAYLAASPGVVERSALQTLFCQRAADPAATLRWHLSRLRRGVHPQLLVTAGGAVALNRVVVATDLARFRSSVAAPADVAPPTLAAALELYRGPFLDGLALRGAPEFDLWLLGERATAQQFFERGALTLLRHHVDAAQQDAAIALARKLLTHNPLLEEAHAALVRLYALTGQREAAVAQYKSCSALLQEELAVAPSAELVTLYAAIRAGDPLPGVAERAAPAERKVPAAARRPFVGRRQEQDRLRRAWAQGGVTGLVAAPAGGGKTHLIAATAPTLDPRPVTLTGRAFESTRNLPFHPWLTIAETCLETLPSNALSRLAAPWRAQLARLLPHSFPDQPAPEDEQRFFRALVELLLLAPAALIVVEDLQWADASSLQLFLFCAQQLARRGRGLLLGTYRSEEVDDAGALQLLLADLRRHEPLLSLPLAPLGVAEIERLLIDHPGGLTAAQLARQTGGNPLFVIELLDDWPAGARSGDPPPVPPGVRDIVARRLERLPVVARQVLETIAVLDQPVQSDLLRHISGRTEDEVVAAVELGQRRLLLAENGAETFSFRHDLLAAAVRAQLSGVRRALLHRRAGDALSERAYPPATLAFHWQMAGDRVRHGRSALRAGERALQLGALRDAQLLCEQALETLPPQDRRRRFRALLCRARTIAITGSAEARAKALAALDAAAARSGQPVDRAENALCQAQQQLDLGAYQAVRQITRAGLRWAELARNGTLRAELLGVAAAAERDQGQYEEAQALFGEALVLHERYGDNRGMASALSQLGRLSQNLGRHREAIDAQEEALVLYRESGDLFNVSRVLAMLGGALWATGELQAAARALDEGLALAREMDDQMGAAGMLNNLGGIAIAAGDLDAAARDYGAALAIVEQHQHVRAMAICHNNLAGVYVSRNDLPAALPHLQKALGLAQENEMRHLEAQVHYTWGKALSSSADLAGARSHLERSLAQRQALGENAHALNAVIDLIHVALGQGDPAAVARFLQRAQALYADQVAELPHFTRQHYHYAVYRAAQGAQDENLAATALAAAHAALQERLAGLDAARRQKLLVTDEIEAIMAAVANIQEAR